MQADAMAGILVLVTSRAPEELTLVKLQVRRTDQVWYHHQLQVSSLAGDLQWCSCPLLKIQKKSAQSEWIPVTSRGTRTLMDMRTELKAVPHAGLGFYFLRVPVGSHRILEVLKGKEAQSTSASRSK